MILDDWVCGACNGKRRHRLDCPRRLVSGWNLELVRDGTIFGSGRTEIDFRTPDYSVWLTIKADSDEAAEAVAAALESAFGEREEATG